MPMSYPRSTENELAHATQTITVGRRPQTSVDIYFRSQHRPPPHTFFAVGKSPLAMGVRWFLVSRLGPRLLLVSAPVVAMPDDDQLSDLASVQILSHPHLAQIRSRSHQWPPRATVPEPLQAAGKLPCATTLSSLDAAVVTRRRRRVTSFAFPSGGAPTGASLHLRLPLRRRRPGTECADCIYGTDCADCGPRFPPPPPICAETCNWASDADCDGGSPGSEFRPAPGRRHVDRPIVICCKVAVCVRPVHNQSKNKSSKGRATHHRNDKRGWGSRR